MSKPSELFGHTLQPSRRKRTITDQVYEILQHEIHEGRWRVGDRLPSLSALAQESGLSNWPLQRAFEILCEDGYVTSKKNVGYFLRAVNPKGDHLPGSSEASKIAGNVIGVAIRDADDSSVWSVELPARLPALHEAAEKRGYTIETKYLGAEEDWTQITRVGVVFGRDTLGVISLYPFPHADEEDLILGPDRFPFVYLGSSTSTCLPVVCGDTYNGFSRLTKRIIELGHRDIIMMGEPDQSPREVENRYLGYARAMEHAGLTPNRDAHTMSLDLRAGDLGALREFLDRWSNATAIISARTVITQDIIAMAEMMGRHVPEDLSVGGHGPQSMRPQDKEHILVGLGYDQSFLANQCLDMLEHQALTRECSASRLITMPTIVEGHSLAPPRSGKEEMSMSAGISGPREGTD